MSEKKYFSDNGLTHLKNVLKTKIKKTYVGETEPTDESVIVWIKPSEAGTEIPTFSYNEETQTLTITGG